MSDSASSFLSLGMYSAFPRMIAALGLMFGPLAIAQSAYSVPIADRPQIGKNYRALPLNFESNQGQTDPRIKFLSDGSGYSLFFSDNDAVIALSKKIPGPTTTRHQLNTVHSEGTQHNDLKTDIIRMQLVDSQANVTLSGEGRLPGTVNYFNGNDPTKWHSGVSTFERVKYANVYPGVNLVYYGNHDLLEFDFEVAPGADPRPIRVHFDGARRLGLDHEGNLTIIAENGEISFHRPMIYQIVDENRRRRIEGTFRLESRNTVSFHLGSYDHTKPLVIDPILTYSTYLGTVGAATAIAVDSTGSAYVTGWSELGLPTTTGAFQPTSVAKPSNVYSAFITKFNSAGTALVYSTYISGSNVDEAYAIAVDAQGNAYVAGQTGSFDFPVTPGALQTKNKTGSGFTGFITKLNSTGTSLVYSTYLGGSVGNPNNPFTTVPQDKAVAIAVDAAGEVYVTGTTGSIDFPTTPGAFQTVNKATTSNVSGFVTKINATGTALVYSTYLGGSTQENPAGIALDTQGNSYIAGATDSNDFPTTSNAFQLANKAGLGFTGFLTKMNNSGTSLVYSTYLGGSREDAVNALSLDSSGDAYLTGFTVSGDFPTTPGAFQSVLAAQSQNAFVTKVNTTGTALVYSTLLGGSGDNSPGAGGEDNGVGIAVDSLGNAFIVGGSHSTNFPTTPGALETANIPWLNSGDSGTFLTKLNSTGTQLLYSTYLGGSGDLSGETCDCARGIALDSAGNAYVGGVTVSTDFPTTLGAFQITPALTSGVFVTKFNGNEMRQLPLTTTTVTANVDPQVNGSPVVFTVQVKATSGSSTPSGTIGISVNGNQRINLPLDATGSATYTTSTLPSGPDVVFAYYLGDANNAPSDGSTTETITPLPSVVNVTSSANPVTYGVPVTFTVSVQDSLGNGIPGFITFNIGSTQESLVNLDSTGQGTWTTSSLPAGTDMIGVRYFSVGLKYASNTASITENVTALGIAATPVFSPVGGTYTSSQQVAISDTTQGASIYYTTDGSVPAINSGTRLSYFQPVSVGKSQTLNAIAIAPGYSLSSVASAVYTINLPPSDFTLSLSSAALQLTKGQSAPTTVTVASINGFNQPVSLTCAGLLAGLSCNFSPVTVTPLGLSATSTLTLTASATARSTSPALPPFGPVTSVAFVVFWLGTRKRQRDYLFQLVAVGAVSLFFLSGCTSSNSPASTAKSPVTSAVTITATAGSLVHSATLTVTVN
jgi:Chitobiase/beta-hexosaminidase C-terminal domain/Bacterial Ig-like domain (group 3)/Beta-propeller repeat